MRGELELAVGDGATLTRRETPTVCIECNTGGEIDTDEYRFLYYLI
jgi:hypothetical protein